MNSTAPPSAEYRYRPSAALKVTRAVSSGAPADGALVPVARQDHRPHARGRRAVTLPGRDATGLARPDGARLGGAFEVARLDDAPLEGGLRHGGKRNRHPPLRPFHPGRARAGGDVVDDRIDGPRPRSPLARRASRQRCVRWLPPARPSYRIDARKGANRHRTGRATEASRGMPCRLLGVPLARTHWRTAVSDFPVDSPSLRPRRLRRSAADGVVALAQWQSIGLWLRRLRVRAP